MKVKLLVALAGPGGSWSEGETVDWEAADAGRLVAAGFAEPVKQDEGALAKADAEPARRVRKAKAE